MGQENANLAPLNYQQASTPAATSIYDFQVLKLLGYGTFAQVFLAKRLANNQLYAIKVIYKKKILEANELTHTLAERKILASLNSPFLVKLHGAFQTSELLYLVIDFVPGGELFSHLQKQKSFSEGVARMMIAQILLGLFELHKNNIIMRDLKPENVLMMQNGYLKITDFGLSKTKEGGADSNGIDVTGTTFCGTAEYLSPEQIRNQPHSVEVDYWAAGTILYELIHGVPPFYTKDHKTMFKQILRGEAQFSAKFSAPCKDFIKAMLQKDPKKRLGAGGNFKQIMEHPFFKGLDWQRLANQQYEMEYKPEKDVLLNFDKQTISRDIDQAIFDVKNAVEDYGVFDGFGVDKGTLKTQTLPYAPPIEQAAPITLVDEREIYEIEHELATPMQNDKKVSYFKKIKKQHKQEDEDEDE